MTRMNRLIAILTLAILPALFSSLLPTLAHAASINGAGATFPYPIYAKWAYEYNKKTGVELNYQSIGSGGGIKQIENKTVDFGASDAPLEPEKLAAAGLFQFPMIIGGVVPVLNVKGFKPGEIKLSTAVLASIFLGTVKTWNDPAIAAINPGKQLPKTAITVVHRADGSGTSWIFTHYLDKVSPAWHDKVGFGKAVEWPVGVGGKGNEGVASYVERINGSIGYVEYAYVVQNKMNHVALQNRAGKFVLPTAAAFQAAAANAQWREAPGYYLVLTDQPGAESWPISGASFILMHKAQADTATGKRVLEFFSWCFHNGQKLAEDLHYVPMPAAVVEMVEKDWSTVFTPQIWTH